MSRIALNTASRGLPELKRRAARPAAWGQAPLVPQPSRKTLRSVTPEHAPTGRGGRSDIRFVTHCSSPACCPGPREGACHIVPSGFEAATVDIIAALVGPDRRWGAFVSLTVRQLMVVPRREAHQNAFVNGVLQCRQEIALRIIGWRRPAWYAEAVGRDNWLFVVPGLVTQIVVERRQLTVEEMRSARDQRSSSIPSNSPSASLVAVAMQAHVGP